jgi:DNA polymerase I-like protein with 3'-5' exonuclease and polymerase domains
VLLKLKGSHPIVEKVMEYKELRGLLDRYYGPDNYAKYINPNTGR